MALTFPTKQTVYEGSRQNTLVHAREDFQTVSCGITRAALCRLAGKDVPDADRRTAISGCRIDRGNERSRGNPPGWVAPGP
jgi:hypothetical protein